MLHFCSQCLFSIVEGLLISWAIVWKGDGFGSEEQTPAAPETSFAGHINLFLCYRELGAIGIVPALFSLSLSLSLSLSPPFSLSSTYLCYQVGFCASVRRGYRTIWTEAPRRLSQIKTQPVKSAKETISTFNLTLPSPAFQKEKKGLLLIRLASSGRT